MTIVTVGIFFGAAGGGKRRTTASSSSLAFMAQFSAAAAYNITYAPYVERLLALPAARDDEPLDHRLRVLRRVGSAIWLIALGAWLAVSLGADDGLVGLMTAGNNVIDGLGDLAAFFSAAALAATMGMNAYGGTLTVLTAVDSVRPIKPDAARARDHDPRRWPSSGS